MLLLIPGSAAAIENDKIMHFGVSVGLGAVSETYLHYNTELQEPKRILYGGLLGTLPGLVKEFIDAGQSDNHFSGSDLVADIAGAFVGSVAANFVNNRLQVNIQKKDDTTQVSLSYKF